MFFSPTFYYKSSLNFDVFSQGRKPNFLFMNKYLSFLSFSTMFSCVTKPKIPPLFNYDQLCLLYHCFCSVFHVSISDFATIKLMIWQNSTINIRNVYLNCFTRFNLMPSVFSAAAALFSTMEEAN